MHSAPRFSSLVIAGLGSWAAVAGVLALSNCDPEASGVHTIAGAFPTAEAGFAAPPRQASR